MLDKLMKTINMDDALFFYDVLSENKAYATLEPRNHESLFFITDGTLEYTKNGKTEFVKKGQVGYIARGSMDKSGAYNCPVVSYIAVNFNFDRKNPKPQATLPFNTVCFERDSYKYEKFFRDALDAYSSGLSGAPLICGGILRQIIGMLYNNYIMDDFDMQKARKIEKSVDYIKYNYHISDMKISEVAEMSNMSEKHFRRLFCELYNKTPHEFLRDFRLDKAKVLLLNTSKQISDIATQCGFSDVYSFSHCFKNKFSNSPKAYREMMK